MKYNHKEDKSATFTYYLYDENKLIPIGSLHYFYWELMIDEENFFGYAKFPINEKFKKKNKTQAEDFCKSNSFNMFFFFMPNFELETGFSLLINEISEEDEFKIQVKQLIIENNFVTAVAVYTVPLLRERREVK